MMIEIGGLSGRTSLKTFVQKKIAGAFEGLRAQPVSVRVGFVDENGPKGGVAIRCGINVDVPRRAPIHLEHRANTERLAFDGVLAALERSIERERGRMRAGRRRPKKYYLAKRLLMPDESLATVANESKPPRRSALRRTA
jgi:ribosome-associated translation inhibitor RaiA